MNLPDEPMSEDFGGTCTACVKTAELTKTLIWPNPQIPDLDVEGFMSPPWIKYPNLPMGSMGWRMGAGEEYQEEFGAWWYRQDGAIRASCEARYPSPAEWGSFWQSLPKEFAPETIESEVGVVAAAPAVDAAEQEFYSHHHFLKHCEIAALLLNRPDFKHPSIKHHIRAAVREASNHAAHAPGKGKQSARYMSKAAQGQMEAGSFDDLVDEHVVPVSLMNEMVLKEREERPATEESVARIIAAYAVRAVITKAEDMRLNQLGYGKVMPMGTEDLLARYAAAGINLVGNQYATLSKSFSGRSSRRSAID